MQYHQEACWVAAQHEVWLVSTPRIVMKKDVFKTVEPFLSVIFGFLITVAGSCD